MDMHTWQILAICLIAALLCIATLVVTVRNGHL